MKTKVCLIIFLALAIALVTESTFAQSPALAPTPPMGWNSWNHFGLNISDTIIRAQANAMVTSGLKSAGYQYVVIDGGWEAKHDTNGIFHSNPDTFPDM